MHVGTLQEQSQIKSKQQNLSREHLPVKPGVKEFTLEKLKKSMNWQSENAKNLNLPGAKE